MDFKIPEKFKVGGQEMTISYRKNEEMPNLGCMGRCFIKYGQILINEDQTPSCMRNTFLHEMIHSILDTAGYDELSNDETFVSTFASFLNEIIDSIKPDTDGE